VLAVDKAVVIRAPEGAWIEFEQPALFEIRDGGSLWLDGITVSGRSAPDYLGNSVIRTSRNGVLTNYEIKVDDSEFRDLDVNREFHFLSANRSSMADRIEINESIFKNISGSVVKLDREGDDFGIYNAEYVIIKNTSFENIKGPLASVARRGRDESTFGPHVTMKQVNVRRVGSPSGSDASLYFHGVQVATIEKSDFEDSAPIVVEHTVGDPVTIIADNAFINTDKPAVIEFYTRDVPKVSLQGNTFSVGEK
jgi:poly(beta-D-mannuronate) lyase